MVKVGRDGGSEEVAESQYMVWVRGQTLKLQWLSITQAL